MNHSLVARCSAILAIFLIPLFVLAQPFRQDLGIDRVLQGGAPLHNAFTGGIDSPVFQCVDIDGDGKLDLFLLDKDRRLLFYQNGSSDSSPQFKLSSFHFQNLDVGSWFRFVDIDADGDQDLFCNGHGAEVNFYRNTGTTGAPQYFLEIETVKDSSGSVILSEEISIPAFADPDGDGDFDFFAGNSVGSIWYYENVGTATNFQFRFVTEKYQGITITGFGGVAREVKPGVKPGRGSPEVMETSLHGAMGLGFGDVDGDGDQDLVWGDFFNRSLYFLRNNGTPTGPQFVLTDSTWPKEDTVLTDGFNMPQLADLDNDGKIDLLVGVLYPSFSLNNLRYYRNAGTAQDHQFVLETMNLIPMLDVGSASSPTFADIGRNGTLDLIVGSEDRKLVLYILLSSDQKYFHYTDYFTGPKNLFNVSPAIADFNNNYRLDLLLGDANGRLRWFEESLVFVEDTTFSLRSFSFGQNASPAFADIDGNGLLDLFVGTGGGRIHFFRNTGTATNPVFFHESDFFLFIDVGDDAKPVFADLDNDGDPDLVVGARDGTLSYWRNDGTPSAFSFVPINDFFAGINAGARAAPAFADIDGDGDLDLFLGNTKGGLYFYYNDRIVSGVEQVAGPVSFNLYQNYPNPFNPVTSIEIRIVKEDRVNLAVFDLRGRQVAVLANDVMAPGVHRISWDATGLTSGVYFYRLRAGTFVESKKMILIR